MTLGLVWAQSPDGVIGQGGALPWRVPEDMAHFRAVTDGHPVVMGRATWDSLPPRYRPLPGRQNIVLSRTPDLELPGAVVVRGLEDALALVGNRSAWVVGGGAVYAAALPFADVCEVTLVDVHVEGDTWAPPLDPSQWRVDERDPASGWHESSAGPRYRFETYRRV